MDPLTLMRDDGPIVHAMQHAGSRPLRWAAHAVLVGTGVAIAALAGTTSRPVVPCVVAAFVIMIGVLGRSVSSSRWAWLMPALVRLVEFTAVIRAAQLQPTAVWVQAYAFLAVLALHYYDIVYRLRATGSPPARWVTVAGGGWDLRLLALCLLSLTPAIGPALIVGAVGFGTLFFTEAVRFWDVRGRRPAE